VNEIAVLPKLGPAKLDYLEIGVFAIDDSRSLLLQGEDHD
jgi:hypothetical protein